MWVVNVASDGCALSSRDLHFVAVLFCLLRMSSGLVQVTVTNCR
jgi:hypothetical protein